MLQPSATVSQRFPQNVTYSISYTYILFFIYISFIARNFKEKIDLEIFNVFKVYG